MKNNLSASFVALVTLSTAYAQVLQLPIPTDFRSAPQCSTFVTQSYTTLLMHSSDPNIKFNVIRFFQDFSADYWPTNQQNCTNGECTSFFGYTGGCGLVGTTGWASVYKTLQQEVAMFNADNATMGLTPYLYAYTGPSTTCKINDPTHANCTLLTKSDAINM